jgi:molecular chaperone DnaJ
MSKRDYYDVLGCNKGAAIPEIKAAYRRLAMELHPDRNPGDHTAEGKFKEINEAYDVLKDDQKRAAYDRFGHAAFEQGGMGNGFHGGGANPFEDISDVFESIFGEMMGGGRGRKQNRGSDLRFNLQIGLEEAFKGSKAEIKVPSAVACEACKGSGAEAGTSAETCPTCQGHGKVRASQGFFTIERTCPQCQGRGRIVRKPCKSCGGAGHVQKERTLVVDIPPGVEEGTRIRLSGEGQAGFGGGPNGDLYVFLSVAQHPIFTRDGHDLYTRVPVSFVTAALGGALEVPTLDGGKAGVKIAEGTQTGRQYRIRGKGMPVLRGGGLAGDLFVEIFVETPVKLSKAQKDLLHQFQESGSQDCQPECEGFFARVKAFWDSAAPKH